MKVPLLDLKPQYSQIEEEVWSTIQEICRSQQFVLGVHVETLEQAISDYCDVRYAVGVSSGTDALLLALMTLGVGRGDEVVTSPYTFFATGGVVARLGATPVFCDIDPVSYNVDPKSVESFITAKCEYKGGELRNMKTGNTLKAILAVHLYGQLANMGQITALAHRYHLKIVEDAAQALGSADSDGNRAGGFGDIGCFSFFPTKNLGAFGDAGMCVANDAKLAERMRILRVHGGHPKYHHSMIGGNFRLDALQAAILSVKLKWLDEWTAARQRNAAVYDEAFSNTSVIAPKVTDGYRHTYNQYVVRVQRRDELREYLSECGVGTEIYYPVPLHMQECFQYLGYRPEDLPEAKKAAESTLALPIYPDLTGEQLEYVVDAIKSFYR